MEWPDGGDQSQIHTDQRQYEDEINESGVLVTANQENAEDDGVRRFGKSQFIVGKRAKTPVVPSRMSLSISTGDLPRHQPEKLLVEPKVLSPHKTRRGQVPRRIEVERKKRTFAALDLTSALVNNGVIKHLMENYFDYPPNSKVHPADRTFPMFFSDASPTPSSSSSYENVHQSIDTLPLSLFDDLDYESRSMQSWCELLNSSIDKGGLPARALTFQKAEINAFDKTFASVNLLWKNCRVIRGDAEKNRLYLYYVEDKDFVPKSKSSLKEEAYDVILERIYVCFDAEDPFQYCKRLAAAIERKKMVKSTMALNLYIDSMPVDNLKPLDSEQVARILENAVNSDALRSNSALDTGSILQQYNLNHMRTMNQLIFQQILKKMPKDVKMVKSHTLDVSLFPNPKTLFPPRVMYETNAEVSFEETLKSFKFYSLHSKLEAMRILFQIQNEIVNMDRLTFFANPEKTLRVEEFTMNQTSQANYLNQQIRELWVNTITSFVRSNLKDVKKGWFNLEESNLEVYNFSKLRKFLLRINFVMEDNIRNFLYRTVKDYVRVILRLCPESITVKSNALVDVVGGAFPLFTVDLKFVNPTPTTEASFIYTATPEQLLDAVLSPPLMPSSTASRASSKWSVE